MGDPDFYCNENVPEQRRPVQQADSRPAGGEIAASPAPEGPSISYGWRFAAAAELLEMIG
jgi:hypothetical protein